MKPFSLMGGVAGAGCDHNNQLSIIRMEEIVIVFAFAVRLLDPLK